MRQRMLQWREAAGSHLCITTPWWFGAAVHYMADWADAVSFTESSAS